MFSFFKKTAIFTAVIGVLLILGGVINSLFPWSYITSFFGIIKYFSNLISFTWDMVTLWKIFGLSLTVEIAICLFLGKNYVIGFFNKA